MTRLHPRSAVVRVARGALQGAFFGFFAGSVGAGTAFLPALSVPLVAVFGALLGGGYALARYLRFRYELDGDTLSVESGVFARQSRQIPLGRVQNVDVEQNVVNRLLGLAVVRFETAGGSATEATLDAVDESEVDRLRNYVRRRERETAAESRVETDAARTGAGESDAGETTDDAFAGDDPGEPTGALDAASPDSEPDGDLLFEFGWRELLTYAVVSVRPAAPVLTLAGLPLGMDLVRVVLRFNADLVGVSAALRPWLFGSPEGTRLLVFAAVTLTQFLLLALAVSVALTVVEYHGFRLTRANGDLRYERGLLRRYSGNIPLEKVQTLTVRENVLMRRFGYASLAVETAGYSGGDQQSTQGVAVPLAARDEVSELARDVEPFGDLDFERPPERARRRYVARFSIAAAGLTAVAYAADSLVFETGYWWLALALFLPVVPAAHLRWRHRGFDLDDSVLATRSGFWRRTTRLVPYYRLQTVFVTRSPFQRRRDLATVGADTASSSSLLGGVARAYDLDEEVAVELREELRRRLTAHIAMRRRGESTADDADVGDDPNADEAVADDEAATGDEAMASEDPMETDDGAVADDEAATRDETATDDE
ncbi:PH domain-containing protein [Haloarcula salina]|uniref:PH domain-containing protein n=1 Tax=Haloarcula salina TaxID=1429914 RepID=A0AA41G2M9_9EURY|nr:PH domain-containing protein [Haloarcula salina]MBV0903227.1 PH domain-containing protein [Haloarcula salina]